AVGHRDLAAALEEEWRVQADARADLEHALAGKIKAEACEMRLARLVDGVCRRREEDLERIFPASRQAEALHQGLGHFSADLTMRQPFWRWRQGDQTWRLRIICHRWGSLSGPAMAPASSTKSVMPTASVSQGPVVLKIVVLAP